VSEAIERDFQTMVWLAHAAGQLLPATRALRLDDTLKQFAAPLHEQVRAAAAAAAAGVCNSSCDIGVLSSVPEGSWCSHC
jgi:hypothetical protein